MEGRVSGNSHGGPVIPMDTGETEAQSTSSSKGITAVNGQSQLPKSESINPKPIADRNVSVELQRIDSADSGYEEGSDDLFAEENYTALKELFTKADDKGTLAELDKYHAANENFAEIEKCLQDETKTLAEKGTFLFEATTAVKEEGGLASHMNRPDNPTHPKTVIAALTEMFRMLNQLVDITEQSTAKQITEASEKGDEIDASAIKQTNEQILLTTATGVLDTSDGPCFEARLMHAQTEFATFLGMSNVENDNIIDLDDILDPELPASKILEDKCAKYMEKCSDQLDDDGMIIPEKFETWVQDQNMLLGFNAADKVITTEVISAFVDEMIDACLMTDRSS